ncbi:MAG: site-specific integrase [Oscillospiraceae bacterium]
MATIEKRKGKDGSIEFYVIRVYRGYSEEGKRLKPFSMTYRPEKGMSQKQIEKELVKRATDFEEQCKMGGVANPTMKMSEFCKQYLDIMKTRLSPITLNSYSNQISNYIIPALGHLKLKDITTAHIQAYITQLANMPKCDGRGMRIKNGDKVSAATVRRYLTVLQSILKQAVKLGIIPESPAKAERLTIPKVQQPKIQIFTPTEASEMIECLKQEDLQFQVLIQLAIITGARRGELVALKFSDIDYDTGLLTIERAAVKVPNKPVEIKSPKDYETRSVTIDKSCLELIRKLKEEKDREEKELGSQWRGEEWLFTQWNGEMMNPMTPTKQFSKFLARNGLKHRKFHSLRHTSATLMLYGGVSIKQVQRRLGHGDIETTNKYLHVLEEADKTATDILRKMIESKENEKAGDNSSKGE